MDPEAHTPPSTSRRRAAFDGLRLLSSQVRSLIILAADVAIATSCLWLALLLRFDGRLPREAVESLPTLVALLGASRLVSNVLLRIHRWSFRFSGLADGTRVVLAGVFGTGLFTSGLYLANAPGPPRSVVVMELLMSTALMATVRFAPRLGVIYRTTFLRRRRNGAVRTLIVGAGSAGEMLLRDLQRSDEHTYQVVGFVDDDPAKWGHVLGGKSVLGAVSDLPKLVVRHGVRRILLAIPRLPASRVRQILSICAHLKVQFKVLPVSYVYLQEQGAPQMLEDLSTDDLLEREEVTFSHQEAESWVRGRIQMVTGAAGSIGREVCRQLLSVGGGRVIMVDCDENDLYLLKRRLDREVPAEMAVTEVADVRDAPRMEALFAQYRPHDVFHAAARKQVPLMESAPCEAVKTNVFGTLLLARIAERFGVERFVLTSSDKAVRPTSVMGATKRLSELVLRDMGRRSSTRFCVVRFGNVLDSAGSVVPLFRDQIAAGGPVTVTHPQVRRYFMTISEAVGLVLRAAYGDFGDLCVLEMGEQIRILDLARHMITMAGLVPEEDVAIQFIGLRPGEKLYEELVAEGEEVVRRVDRKISIVRGLEPPPGLLEAVDRLAEAARREDAATVLTLLRRLVPDFRPLHAPEPAARPVAPIH